jgi:hypothetical protein
MATTKASNSPSPSPVPNNSTLYLAIEDLSHSAAAVFAQFEDAGDLSQVVLDLGTLRDRADSIQNVVLAHIEAINTHL